MTHSAAAPQTLPAWGDRGAGTRQAILLAAAAVADGLAGGPTGAACFDCGKVPTRLERTICSDPLRSGMDGVLGDAFSEAAVRAVEKGIDRTEC